jgi:hypothetical protein
VSALFNILSNLILFALLVFVGGLGTAWYMVDQGSSLTTRVSGPWVTWTTAGRSDADPYTRAHFVRAGVLPLATSLALTYQAKMDSDGNRLHSTCEYTILLGDLDAQWWSLAVFDANGGLIPNPAERYAFNGSTVTRDSEGRVFITLASDARPGNWLPTGGAGKLNIVFIVQDPKWVAQNLVDSSIARSLPDVRKVTCQ